MNIDEDDKLLSEKFATTVPIVTLSIVIQIRQTIEISLCLDFRLRPACLKLHDIGNKSNRAQLKNVAKDGAHHTFPTVSLLVHTLF